MLKKTLYCILLLSIVHRFSYAQLSKIPYQTIDEGVSTVSGFLDNAIKPGVKFFGIGDFQFMLKESSKLNSAIAAYLISRQKVNTICIPIPDWEVRILNEYIQNDKSTHNKNFDTLFRSIFGGSEYNNQTYKDLFLWVKNWNNSNTQNPVSIKGVGYLGLEPAKFPKMNAYLIETYFRPYNKVIADSMSAAWERVGNSNSLKSDAMVLAYLKSYIAISENTKALPIKILAQLKLDYNHRLWMYNLLSSDIPENDKIFSLIKQKTKVEADLIDTLLKMPPCKLIFLSTNSSVMNVHISAISKLSNQALLIPTNGSIYKEKYRDEYLCTIISFSDSANVIGTKGSLRYHPILIFGDEQTKNLRKKQEVFFYSESDLQNLKIPIINTGAWGGEEVQLLTNKSNNNASPYDILFIFKTLTRINPLE